MWRYIIAFGILFMISCGCLAVTDEVIGIWQNEKLSLHEKMTVKADGTYIMSDMMDGNEISRGTWMNIEGCYIFTQENSGEKSYAGIVRGGRGQVFLIFGNITYIKI